MLVALAQRPQGLNASQLALLTGMSKNGGSFRTYASKGRVAGWIEGDPKLYRITRGGIQALGPFERLPEGPALLEHWATELGDSGATRMLRALANAHPRALTREQLSAATGMGASGGSFRTYVSKLRVLGLIVQRGQELGLSEELV